MKFKRLFSPYSAFALCFAANLPLSAQISTWNGGGADTNWSTAANWDFIPIDGDNLVFDGTTALTNTNDFITSLGSAGAAFTFPVTADSFVINDGGAGTVTIGTAGANGDLANVDSIAPQEIALDLQLAGGNKANIINLAAGSKLTLSGNIDSSNNWLFPNGGAGTVELTGNNTGPGNGMHTGGTNNIRGFMRLNSSGQTIALGSPTALGDPNVDFANQRGLRMNTGSQTLTTVGGMDLVGPNMVNNTISFNESTSYIGAGDLEVGGLVYTKTNGRAWSVDGGGEFIISGQGVMMTTRTAAQVMILQPLNGNVITVNGQVHDTFQSGGIETKLNGNGTVPADGILRLQGSGTINLNANSSTTMNAEVLLNSANITVKLGDANALGSSGDPFEQEVSVDKLSNTYTTAPTNEIDVADTVGIEVGYLISGPGIPIGTLVTGVDAGANTVTMDMDATADAVGVTLNFAQLASVDKVSSTFIDAPANEINVADTDGIEVGAEISGPGIPIGTVVTGFDAVANTVTMDMDATAAAFDVILTFASSSTPATETITPGRTDMNAGVLDLNGFAVNETFVRLGSGHRFFNSNTGTPAEVLTEIVGQGFLRVDGPGDLVFNNVRHPGGVGRGTIKDGAGTLTLGGDVSNNRYGLTVNEGNVILAKTAGEAVSRFALILNNAASTVTLTNVGEQIGNQTDVNGLHQINEGTLDLNGFDESLGALSTTNGTEHGGIVTNGNTGTTSTLTLLGAGTDATFPGTISGDLNLVKGGAPTQTLTGTLAYTGDTTINDGILALGATSDLDDNSAVFINGLGGIDIAAGVTDVVDQLWIDGAQQAAGTYGSVGSGATNEDNFLYPGDGILSVTSDPVTGSADYDTWAASFSLTGGPTDDDDNDGVSNNDEYAFGLDPTSGSSVCPFTGLLEMSAGTFSYTRRDPVDSNLTYTVYTSTTLEAADWTLDATATQIAGATDGAGNQTVDVTLSTVPTATKLFVRVEAN
ncbi:MAG: beta strand repeat-containing protein [Roseibacillus sp.]